MNLQGDLDIPSDTDTFSLTPVAGVAESARALLDRLKNNGDSLYPIDGWAQDLQNNLDVYDAWLSGEAPDA